MPKNREAVSGVEPRTAYEDQMQREFSPKSTAREAQISRALEMLQHGPRNTYEFRQRGISHPAARIIDLRRRGYVIESARITTVDGDSFTHVNVALYSLQREPQGVEQ